MKILITAFEQPAGTFYFGAVPATDIAKISVVNPRFYNPLTEKPEGGVQRDSSKKRIKEIADYARSPDASFPTPVILALTENSYFIENEYLTIHDFGVADIVDGQHRIEGLKESGVMDKFTLPVVFLLDPTEEEKALIFATINGKQTTVPASLVYDLFGVTKSRSPQKTCHEIARAMNSSELSPWRGRLKMLGKKTLGTDESLSQGSFIKFLLPLITSNPTQDMTRIKSGEPPEVHPHCIFNEYFNSKDDEVILKVLLNVFNAVKVTWPDEWADPSKSVLTKTTGYTGIMTALPELVKLGKKHNILSQKYFNLIFEKTKEELDSLGINLTSGYFNSSARGEAAFKKHILDSTKRITDIEFDNLKS